MIAVNSGLCAKNGLLIKPLENRDPHYKKKKKKKKKKKHLSINYVVYHNLTVISKLQLYPSSIVLSTLSSQRSEKRLKLFFPPTTTMMIAARCSLFPPPCFSAVRVRCFAGETSDTGILFREKLIYLQDLNVDPHKALRVNPSLRSAPISSVVSVETLLSSTGLSRPAVGRILDMFPDLLTSDPESEILPVLRFLSDEISISEQDIPKSISRCPRLLISSVDFQLRPALAFLKTLGFVGRDTITSRTTVLLVSNVERTLIPKIEYLEVELGFTREEVAKMVVRSPALLTYSVDNNLAPKVEFFMEEMSGDVKELKRFPQYFSFSLERKIKPRHRLLKEHGILMPLSEMLKVSDGQFNNWLLELRLRSAERR